MKQLGISLKQESSVIKKREKKAGPKKEENKDYHSRCWCGHQVGSDGGGIFFATWEVSF